MEDDLLLTAVAEALREHGVTDPQAVLAVAEAAVRVLGRDQCVCRQAVHAQHHHTPVDRCPWCMKGVAPPPAQRRPGTVTVPTGGLL